MRRETERKHKEICRLYEEGRTREQIAEETFYSRPVVDRILQQYGPITVRETFQDHREEALALWEQGLTLGAIAERTGLGITTVSRNLKKLGKTRGRGGRKKADIPAQERAGLEQEKTGSAGRAGRSRKTEETEPVPVRYAENRRKAEKVAVRGKVYQDVTAWYM